ncbi:MAG TPA: CehA/McbA family metallohydrolase [Pyrinomonadaceae bacterium]|nr:CehA/McbA family metallohydrolase [Pyrinomonadaceae bacterium]
MIAALPPCPLARVARRFFHLLALCGALLSGLAAPAGSSAHRSVRRAAGASSTNVWYRGNTHSHTTNSDGDGSPFDVASRYKALGYNFVFITDHNKFTDISTINSQLAVPGQFAVLGGEEVTDSFSGKPVHTIGLNNTTAVQPQQGASVLETMNNDFAAVRQAGGLPYIAHPNYGFALTADDLRKMSGSSLFEIYNAHPVVNNVGDATHPSVEAMWDDVLSSGRLLYGVAADDEHNLNKVGGALPGRAWVMVRAASLSAGAITQAMERGDFYASTGVTLQDYQVSATSVTVTVDAASSGPVTIDFIGRNGQLLARSNDSQATYQFTGGEMYVRAKITNDAGLAAWTQPIYTASLSPSNAILNGASFGNEPAVVKTVAPGSIASVNGFGLAGAAVQSQRQADGTFPTSLGGTSVSVNGRPAQIFFASLTQVNFEVPDETEVGTADVVVTNADGRQMRSQVFVANASPGIFTVDGTGRGDAFFVDVATLLSSLMLPDDGARRLHLYGTGVDSATQVQAFVNGQAVAVEAVRPCRRLPGLDQINIAIPPGVLTSGAATLLIRADGVDSNTVTLRL